MSRAADLSPAATLAYGTDSPNQVVDLYVPDGSGPWPLVIGIHGSAFRAGTRNWDFLQMDAQFIALPPTGDVPPVQNHDEPGSPESQWIGGPIQSLPETTARANPITYVTRATVPLPPFFLAAGTSDHLVPHQQTLILADALHAHGTQVELHILENGRHGDQRFETELKQPAIEWLEQSRKPS